MLAALWAHGRSFSILERIVVVETEYDVEAAAQQIAFSIVERIVVVETHDLDDQGPDGVCFQYPRTDRGG